MRSHYYYEIAGGWIVDQDNKTIGHKDNLPCNISGKLITFRGKTVDIEGHLPFSKELTNLSNNQADITAIGMSRQHLLNGHYELKKRGREKIKSYDTKNGRLKHSNCRHSKRQHGDVITSKRIRLGKRPEKARLIPNDKWIGWEEEATVTERKRIRIISEATNITVKKPDGTTTILRDEVIVTRVTTIKKTIPVPIGYELAGEENQEFKTAG